MLCVCGFLQIYYKHVMDDYCYWVLEMKKQAYGDPISYETYLNVIALFEDNLRILHPFVPFISEHIWQNMAQRDVSEALIISKWPELKESNDTLIKNFENAMEVISAIRTIRKERNIAFKEKMELLVINHENLSSDFDGIISKLGNLESITYVTEKPLGALTFRMRSNEYFIPIEQSVDVEEER